MKPEVFILIYCDLFIIAYQVANMPDYLQRLRLSWQPDNLLMCKALKVVSGLLPEMSYFNDKLFEFAKKTQAYRSKKPGM